MPTACSGVPFQRVAFMFRAFFEIEENPFSNTPNPRYFFKSGRHLEALAHLMYGVQGNSGFVLLTGEVGTGKTTVCRHLVDQVPDNVDLALCINPRLNEVELLATICDELGVAYSRPPDSVKALLDVLNQRLLQGHAQGRRAVLIIDEAQHLTPPVLEQVRLLTNLETADTKLLQIILVGQPELKDLLEGENLRQLTQRITARYHLDPMTFDEAGALIRHRLRVAGLATDTFRPDAITEIYAQSGGIPRLIVTICERCLLGAYALGKKHVDEALARAAAKEVLGGIAPARRSKTKLAAAVVGTVLFATATVSFVVLDPLDFGLVPQLSQSQAAAKLRNLFRTWSLTAFDLPSVERSDETPGTAPESKGKPTPAVEEGKLETVIRRPGIAGDLGSAMAVLFAMWNVKPATSGGLDPCAEAETFGLKCYRRHGNWSTLRNMNRPTLIDLQFADGHRVYTVVIALSGDAVILNLGGQTVLASTDEVTRYWSGEILVLWKPSPVYRRDLQIGMRGADVAWLRKRLAEIQGEPADTAYGDTFDTGLQERVIAFQRSRELIGDGLVNPMTLIHLNALSEDMAVPVLRNEP